MSILYGQEICRDAYVLMIRVHDLLKKKGNSGFPAEPAKMPSSTADIIWCRDSVRFSGDSVTIQVQWVFILQYFGVLNRFNQTDAKNGRTGPRGLGNAHRKYFRLNAGNTVVLKLRPPFRQNGIGDRTGSPAEANKNGPWIPATVACMTTFARRLVKDGTEAFGGSEKMRKRLIAPGKSRELVGRQAIERRVEHISGRRWRSQQSVAPDHHGQQDQGACKRNQERTV